MTEGVPLVIPEVNPEAMKGMRYGQGGIIANPNCSTIIALMAVTPLHRAAKVTHIRTFRDNSSLTVQLCTCACMLCWLLMPSRDPQSRPHVLCWLGCAAKGKVKIEGKVNFKTNMWLEAKVCRAFIKLLTLIGKLFK